MKAFVAYRLPHQTKVFVKQGIAEPYASSTELLNKEGFVFHSFNSNKNYALEQLEDCKLTDFESYNNESIPKETSKESYLEICSKLIHQLQQKEWSKVVLSRVKKYDVKLSNKDIFQMLNQTYANTFNYLISIENVGTWIGATPEVLAEFDQEEISTVALAGTKTSPNINWTKKEIEEQQIVTDFIVEQLKPLVNDLKQTSVETFKAGEVYHLKSVFKAKCKSKWTTILDALHPTPATCGMPQLKAKALINTIELHQREFYTGFLGVISPNYKLLMVNLRCMQIINQSAYLYLGGGITSSSNALKEWQETQNKAKTLLNVL